MRVFLSINFDEETIEKLEQLKQEIQKKGVKGYWRRPDNFHLTLKFLGEVELEQINILNEVLRSVEHCTGSFELDLHSLGVFPNLYQPKILWTGFKDQPKLRNLHYKIEPQLEQLGFAREKRKYKPHLTLASGQVRGVNQEILDEGKQFTHRVKVTQFHLMESKVEGGVRKYSVLESFSL